MRPLMVPPNLSLPIPYGAPGTREVLKHMRQLVQQGKTDLFIRDSTNRLLLSIPAKDWLAEITTLFDYVQSSIRYTLDTNNIEVIQSAKVTFSLGYGDCDDMCIALATILEIAGHSCAFLALGFDQVEDYTHVIVLVNGAGETGWISLDPTESHEPGWFPPGVKYEMLCPIS
jgi:transglutaminase-like putative cysteine protease